jgi:hypothetical protein
MVEWIPGAHSKGALSPILSLRRAIEWPSIFVSVEADGAPRDAEEAMDPQTVGTVLLLTTNELARRTFEHIAQNRRVRLKELKQEISKDPSRAVDVADVQRVLDELERSKLIARVVDEPSIDDFRTYYLTAEGFAAERKLRELGLETNAG